MRCLLLPCLPLGAISEARPARYFTNLSVNSGEKPTNQLVPAILPVLASVEFWGYDVGTNREQS